jgi:hypothetical protein
MRGNNSESALQFKIENRSDESGCRDQEPSSEP